MPVSLKIVPVYRLRTDLCAVAELGNEGWDWEGLEPYYKKVQESCFNCKESCADIITGGTNDPARC